MYHVLKSHALFPLCLEFLFVFRFLGSKPYLLLIGCPIFLILLGLHPVIHFESWGERQAVNNNNNGEKLNRCKKEKADSAKCLTF